MADHQQPLNAPQPGSQDGSRPATNLLPEDDALMKAQRDFPSHRIWRESIPGRTVYVARSRHLRARPHTVVTPDLTELLAALTEAAGAGRPG